MSGETRDSRENLLNIEGDDVSPKKRTSISFVELFRFSSPFDRLLLILGSLAAASAGLSKPIMSGLLGHLSQAFINFTNQVEPLNISDSRRVKIYSEFHEIVSFYVILYILLFLMAFITGTLQDFCFIIAGENMVNRLRKTFIRAVMRQNIAWFDKQNTGSLTTDLFSNIEKFKNGTGDHIGYSVQTLSMFVGGFAVCFYHDWRLTLVGTCLTPLIALWGYWDNNKMTSLATEQEERDGEAGSVAEQALSSMRTVMMFNGQEQECSRYRGKLDKVKATGIQIGLYNGLWNGVSIFMLFSSFCITVWFGTTFVYAGKIGGGVVITVFICIQLCIGHLDRIAPIVSKVNRARGAAVVLYNIIDRTPEIDAYSTYGAKPELEGRIFIQNLRFNYPSREDVSVLKDVNLTIEPGQTVALVGASGSGKSTIVQLLLRYYDPTDGRITLDGFDLDELNINYLRQKIGVVSQEPILFNTTIEENIRYGREKISESEIWNALKKANAFDFVKEFPQGLKTMVGDRGTQLSGGQKQRIAIARALVRNPKILLLDEATSALDAQSERIVQEALENAAKGRTTLVIAHRLSTIRNADKIIAMRQGEVIETGTHGELMDKKGLYHELVNNQVFVDVESTGHKPQYQFSRSVSSDGTPDYRRLRSLSLQETIPEEDILEDVDTKRLKEEMAEEGAIQIGWPRILKETKAEWKLVLCAFFISLFEGAVYPMLSFCFTELVKIFTSPPDESMLRHGHLFSFVFLYIGFHYCFTVSSGLSLFGIISERLAHRLRMKVYRNVMRQDAAYFDKAIHAPGRLLTRLATDANNIKPAINDRIGFVIAECTTDLLAISFSFYFGWQMALVAVPIFPLAWIAFGYKSRFLARKILQDEKDMENIGKLATEAMSNIRTVHALTLQAKIYQNFCDLLKGPIKTGRQRAILQSLTYGTTVSIHFLLYGLCFRAGLYFIYHNYLDPQSMLRALFMVSFASGSLGAIAEYFPDYIKARMAAGLLFKMMDENPKIDGMSEIGTRPEIEGNIAIKELKFRYPEREDVEVLKGLNLQVKEGQTIALVGASGCGKSTVISLLERLYDPEDGDISLDGFNITSINPKHLRANISIVSQEPVLFDLSIKENIFYGLPATSISHQTMIEAAKKANIHDFISCLPNAYHTRVGDKGTQLSGGQKQRIAIARALVRNPKILLLDEATSALDTESEKHVQSALEKASAGRSCIIVAHRLSTIKNADQIFVFSEGKIAEKGSHEELLAKQGVYFNLIQKQSQVQ